MHFVAALDDVPEMRPILALFEGVVTGAADGYGRMRDRRPAATLLHLGPGLGNGLANLHNARRARTPIVNIVGDHATYHQALDAPLASDIVGVARNVSRWVRESKGPETVGADTSRSDQPGAARRGRHADPARRRLVVGRRRARSAKPSEHVMFGGYDDAVAIAVEGAAQRRAGRVAARRQALRERGLLAASRIAEATGAKLLCETFPARLERGAGLPAVDRLGYLAEFAVAQLQALRHLVLVDAKAPVSFFAYPNLPSELTPDGCEIRDLVVRRRARGGRARGARRRARRARRRRVRGDGGDAGPTGRRGPLNPETIAQAIGALLPEGAIVSDEANTAGLFVSGATAGAPRHDWLTLTGGAIGQGMPVATGAAVACPDRKVLNLQADGSAMYTLQSLWTQAREEPRRHHGHLQQPLVRDLEPGAVARRRAHRRERGRPVRHLAPAARLRRARARHGRRRDAAPRPPTSWSRRWSARLREPGPHLIDAILPARL